MSKDPKRKQDILDPELSKQLAWRKALVPEIPQAASEPPIEASPQDPVKTQEQSSARAEVVRAFAKEILRVWEWPVSAQQRQGTRLLLHQARKLELDIARMVNHPLAALRLLRLAARYARELKIGSMTSFALSWIALPIGHPEMADFIVEVAQCGRHPLLFTLDMAFHQEKFEGKHPSLGKRLVEIFNTTNDVHVRDTTLRLMSLDEFPETIPILQGVLRSPNVTMRSTALAILAQMKSPALREEDVQWLLDDAVVHPLSRDESSRGFERIYNYEDALLTALERRPPPNGWQALETIADHRGVHIRKHRHGLGAEWALEALAAAYPERALIRIDHHLVSPNTFRSYRLTKAIGKLPDEMARPRLIQMTESVNPDVVQAAVKIWFERFKHECPVDPLTGVPTELLAAPPSERMLANLTALRSESHETRNAMLDVLLRDLPEAEGPSTNLAHHQRESLALLMFVFRSRGNAYKHATMGSMWLKDLAKFFLKRGGNLVFDTLARWADEGIRAGVRGGWLEALVDAATEGLLDDAQIEQLRVMARYGLEHPRLYSTVEALSALRKLGAPRDLGPRLLHELMHPDTSIRWPWYSSDAADALSKIGPCAELDEAITRAVEDAYRAQDRKLCERLVRAVEQRNVSAAMDVLMRHTMSYDGARDSAAAVTDAFSVLHRVKRIDDEMVVTILADADNPLFAMAANTISRNSPPACIQALMMALDSPAREGAVAGEALHALLRGSFLPLGDERIDRILETTPLYLKARICDVLIYDGVPLARIHEHVKAGLLSADDSISSRLVDILLSRRPPGMKELLKDVLPNVPEKQIRAVIRRHLELPDEVEEYWEDQKDDAYDEDDDDDENDEDDDDDEPLGDA